jgi:hypothetical protein
VLGCLQGISGDKNFGFLIIGDQDAQLIHDHTSMGSCNRKTAVNGINP